MGANLLFDLAPEKFAAARPMPEVAPVIAMTLFSKRRLVAGDAATEDEASEHAAKDPAAAAAAKPNIALRFNSAIKRSLSLS